MIAFGGGFHFEKGEGTHPCKLNKQEVRQHLTSMHCEHCSWSRYQTRKKYSIIVYNSRTIHSQAILYPFVASLASLK
jgi:Zn finger protein HypA/HybF involved in hydrogenase expression